MSTIRKFVLIFAVMVVVVSACTVQAPATPLPTSTLPAPSATVSRRPATSTPQPTRPIDPAVIAAMEKCANIFPGQACLVEGPVQVTAQPGRTLKPFRQPGQLIDLNDLKSLKLGEAGSARGLVMMRISTEWPGGAFAVVAFGDVELVNEVPYGTREFNPMQSLKLTTGPNQADPWPTNVLFVSSPEDGHLSTLVVNGAELSLGSGALFSGQQGGVSIQTMWGAVAWMIDKVAMILPGERLDLTQQNIQRGEYPQPYRDVSYEITNDALKKYFGAGENETWQDAAGRQASSPSQERDVAHEIISDALKKYFGAGENETWQDAARRQVSPPSQGRDVSYEIVNNALKKFFGAQNQETWQDAAKRAQALAELKKKQKNWKGGWWKMTYGPITTNGQCKAVAGGAGGPGATPIVKEIPICRGNNGNTILMYESGVSYDRMSANLFSQSYVNEYDINNRGDTRVDGSFTTLQVISPTRMILSHATSQANACSIINVVYLDFVRDDPNVRCGKVIYVEPNKTPRPATPTPEPKKVDPPVKGPYQVRLAALPNACDAAAKPFAPNFKTANLSLSPQNKLNIETASTQYELEMADLTYSCSTKEKRGQNCLGLFTSQQPVNNAFNLTLSLGLVPGQQWTGTWLVTNQDASQFCLGSIDFVPPK